MYAVTSLGQLNVAGPNGLNDAGDVVGNAMFYGTPLLFHSYGPAGGTYTDLSGVVGAYTKLSGINDSGQIVGTATVSTPSDPSSTRGFLDNGGEVTMIQPLPGTPDTTAVGINNSGTVIGESGYHGYTYQNGQMTDLGQNIPPTAISNSGIIVASGAEGNGVLYQNGQIISSLPANSWFSAVNDSGQAIGHSIQILPDKTETTYVFTYQNGHLTNLQLPDGSSDDPRGIYPASINSLGQAVGYYFSGPSGTISGFLEQNGKMVDLNSLIPASSGWRITDPVAINAEGQILSYGAGPDGYGYTLLLTPTSMPQPTPEPSTLAIFAAAAAGVVVCLARRRSRS